VLALQLAGRFDEWLCEQESPYDDWSLQGALYEWLYDEAVRWTAESYELYLQIVTVIVAEWSQHPDKFTYQLLEHGETQLTCLSDDRGLGRNINWECIRRDQYERARFLWRLQEACNSRDEPSSAGSNDCSS
jgi:hypothetical protein